MDVGIAAERKAASFRRRDRRGRPLIAAGPQLRALTGWPLRTCQAAKVTCGPGL